MSPDDERHGSWAGYQRGCRDDCCTSAARNYQKRRNYDQQRGAARTVPLAGTERRIHALIALGWTAEHIGEQLGHSRAWVQQVLLGRPGASRSHEERRVNRSTAEKVAALYEELSMRLPPQTNRAERNAASRARNRARARGWLPPLAWEGIDIDNPHAVGTRGELGPRPNRGRPVAEVLEDAEWMADSDASLTEVIERLGMSQATFRETCSRAGRSDLYFRFARREPDGDMRWEVSQAQRRKKAS